MGLSGGQYSLQCWNSMQNPSEIDRPKLLYQSFQLIKKLQEHFKNGEIAIPSMEKVHKKGIEICIIYRAGASLFADIATFLNEQASALRLDYHKFVKQDAGLTRYFSDEEMKNVSLLGKPVPDSLTEQSIAENIKRASAFSGLDMNKSWRDQISPEQRVPSFQITRYQLQRLHEKEGQDLAREIKSILDGIRAGREETKSAYAVVSMIAKGVIGLAGAGFVASELSGSIFGLLVLWNAGFAGAEIAIGSVMLAALIGITGGAYLLLKDATNILIVVNDSKDDLLPRMEWIQNGERRLVPEMIPAAVPNSDFVSVGLFFYSKYQIKTWTIGTYGSAFGVSFGMGSAHFSVGMDCPNSLLGGQNSIEVHNQEHANRACQMALDSHCKHGWTDHPYVDVKIADHRGNINWGRTIAMRQ